MKSDGTFNLDTWVDADFAGLYTQEPPENPMSVKSRYAYIIRFGGMPLVWKTQLISENCLSTLHSEYVGLSNAVRNLIPIRSLVLDTLEQLGLTANSKPTIRCKVFKDNQGAYLLTVNQKLSPRTKYFWVKYHFFWSLVYHKGRNPRGWLIIKKCDTKLMNADYLTKGLTRELLEANCKRVQGW